MPAAEEHVKQIYLFWAQPSSITISEQKAFLSYFVYICWRKCKLLTNSVVKNNFIQNVTFIHEQNFGFIPKIIIWIGYYCFASDFFFGNSSCFRCCMYQACEWNKNLKASTLNTSKWCAHILLSAVLSAFVTN